MAKVPEPSDDGNDGAMPRRAADGTVGAPRWVKVSALAALALVALAAAWHLAGGGFRHG